MRRARGLLIGLAFAVAVTGCDSGGGAVAPPASSATVPSSAVSAAASASSSPTRSAASAAATAGAVLAQRYQQAVLQAGPESLWPLDDAAGAAPGDALQDATTNDRPATLVTGRLQTTPGPLGSPAVRFTGAGRLLAPVGPLLAPGHAFSLEFLFRADSCTRHWTQVLGTASYGARGREGVNLLHYPRFVPGACHLAVEFWQDDHFVGGCGSRAVAQPGDWTHVAVVYRPPLVQCYTDGQRTGQATVATFGPGGPFGIGAAGSGYAGTLDSGSLAEVAVYSRPLPAATIAAHARLLP